MSLKVITGGRRSEVTLPPSDLSSPGRRRAVVVWAWGRAFLATPSLPQMRMVSPGDEDVVSIGVQSGSLDGASMFTLALMTLVLKHWNANHEEKYREQGSLQQNISFILCQKCQDRWMKDHSFYLFFYLHEVTARLYIWLEGIQSSMLSFVMRISLM